MRGEGVGEQARAVLDFPAFGRLLAEFSGAVDVLGVNACLGPVDFRVGIQPVVPLRRESV
ncbi:hypothetical protein D3C72_891580 [compost metagenome]